jgi:FkbH-like protein
MNAQSKLLLISDFTADTLAGYLANDGESPGVSAASAPFNQVRQVLADGGQSCWRQSPDFAVVWTRPEAILPSFARVLDYQPVATEKLLQDVDEYCERLSNITDRVRLALVPTWVTPSYHRGYGILDMKPGIGIANALMKINLRLCEKLEGLQNLYVLNAQKWIEAAGKRAFDASLWYMAKVPFGSEVFKEAAKDVRAAVRAVTGSARKLIILDLDDTLWGGTVGEEGWNSLRLGGHDAVGEAFVEFQAALKSLTHRGVVLGIVSKNDENTALEAIENHPEMVLRLADFAGWRINWADKAQNLADLVSELNLGLQSVVFIDNDPIERARVREALPEVLVPDWPAKQTLFKSTLLNLPYFDYASINKEDRDRTKMYVRDRDRQTSKSEVGSLEEWLNTLDTRVEVHELTDANLPRVAQLFNKTNQFNLSTRRLTDKEIQKWAAAPNRKFWAVRVLDRFGDSGLTGLVSVEVSGSRARIVDFIMSCRVMGRKIEETMLHIAARYAQLLELEQIYARYIPTSKNAPCLEFLEKSGFVYDEETRTFRWDLHQIYPCPDCVELQEKLRVPEIEPALCLT